MLFLIALANFLQRFTYSQTSVRLIRYRLEKCKELDLKSTHIAYRHMEDQEMLNRYNLARTACSNYNTGMEGLLRIVFDFFFNLAAGIGYLIILIPLSPIIVTALIAVTFIIHYAKRKVDMFSISKRSDMMKEERRMGYYADIMSDFAYGKEIRLYGLKDFLSGKYTRSLKTANRINAEIETKRSMVSSLLDILNAIKELGCIGYLLLQIRGGFVSLGFFYVYFNAFSNFSNWINDMAATLGEFRYSHVQVGDFRAFMKTPDVEREGQKELTHVTEVEFRNVSFTYPGTEKEVLRNVSFHLKNGNKYAIVGRNGQGKTTLIKLLCGFYPPTDGEILVNGVRMQEYSRDSYIRQLSVVFQDIHILAFPFATNIAMRSDQNIDRNKIRESLRLAGAEDIERKLTKGYETPLLKSLDPEGIDLSGGEKQKLAMARAAYRDGNILVMDEPTAQLDALAEKQVYEKYLDMAAGKIALFISHRLASTQFCDQIFLIDDGRIVERGMHDELMNQNGMYADMFRVQAHYYVKAEETQDA